MDDLDGVTTFAKRCETPPSLKYKVVRDGKVLDLNISTIHVKETDRLIIFAGCIIQEPHHAVHQAMTEMPKGVYCVFRGESSPAVQYGISATNFITHVNEIPTPDMDSFSAAIKQIPDNHYCKIRLMTYDNVPFAISLKTNYHYFPTAELRKDATTNKWVEHVYKQDNQESK